MSPNEVQLDLAGGELVGDVACVWQGAGEAVKLGHQEGIAEFEADLIRMRTRDGMKVARARGRLRGKQPKLNPASKRTSSRFTRPGPTPAPSSPNCSPSPARPLYRAIQRAGARSAG